MATIYNSLTTPAPVYNLSGTTVDSIADGDCSTGSPVGGAITRSAQVIYPPSGENFGSGVPANEGPMVIGGSGGVLPGIFFRKISSTMWGMR
jgi:hypothetical protein